MREAVVDFWFDFASTYSYPASQRVQALARSAGVGVRFRPFVLGAIFKAQGWDTSPFNIYPTKGRYMWRDLARIADELGLPLVRPDPFPQNSLLAARVAVAAADEPWCGDYCAEIFRLEFGSGRQISDVAVVQSAVEKFSPEVQRFLAAAQSADIKNKLRRETELAERIGIFGSPTFVTEDGELFWGNDRLDSAVTWARRLGVS